MCLQNLFSENVRAVRLARGMSQEEFAGRASLHRTYISSIERKLRNLSIQNIQWLAVAFEVDPQELLALGNGSSDRGAFTTQSGHNAWLQVPSRTP